MPAAAIAGCVVVGVISVIAAIAVAGGAGLAPNGITHLTASYSDCISAIRRAGAKRARTSAAAAVAEPLALRRVVEQLARSPSPAPPASPGATSRPVSPSRMISGSPPWAAATTAQPAAAASSAALGSGSGAVEGTAITSAAP